MIQLNFSKLIGRKSDIVKAIQYNRIMDLQKVEKEVASGETTYPLEIVLKELKELYG